ncbi:MAG: undecaprenyl-phosphate galactose phosphotransferase WbaP [Granulosicoccus sp.]
MAWQSASRHSVTEEDIDRLSAIQDVHSSNRWKRKYALVFSDIFAMCLATLVAIVLSESARSALLISAVNFGIPLSEATRVIMFALPVLLLVSASHVMGHYTRMKPLWGEIKDFMRIVAYTIAVTAVVLFFSKAHFSRLWLIAYWTLIFALVPSCRYLVKLLLIRNGNFFVPVVIFGTGVNALKCAKTILSDNMLGLRVVAFVNTGSIDSEARCKDIPWQMVLDSGYDKSVLDIKYDKPHFLFALDSGEEFEKNKPVLNTLIANSRYITLSPPLYGMPLDGAEVVNVQRCDSLLIRLQNNLAKPHSAFIKRTVDIIGSALAIIILSPFVAVLLVHIKKDGGPVFYKQKRIGRHSSTFDCWKLRSMVVNADVVLARHLESSSSARAEWERDHKLKDDPRITVVGAFIRKGSLDELPQLWNVFKGNMSLIGPRPIVVEEQTKYGELLQYYLGNRPGITGLWQISGRNDTTYDERVDLDVWYSRNWSLWLDVVILVKTIPVVVFGSGAY